MNELQLRSEIAFEGHMMRAAVFTAAAFVSVDHTIAFVFCLALATTWFLAGIAVKTWPEKMLKESTNGNA